MDEIARLRAIRDQYRLPDRQARTSIDPQEELYCICQQPNHGELMIQCDTCEGWFHPHCVSLTDEEAQALSEFHCDDCVQERKAKRPKRLSSASLASAGPASQSPCARQGCDVPCQPGSTYCSKDCGLIVAHSRLPLLLSTCDTSDDTLSQIYSSQIQSEQQKIAEIEAKIQRQAQRFEELQDYMAWLEDKSLAPQNQEHELDGIWCCPVCQKEFGMDDVAKHIHACFKQKENRFDLRDQQEPTLVDCPIQGYCCHHTKSKGWCRRLYYSCTEHGAGKDLMKAMGVAQVACGCPLRPLNGASPDQVEKCMRARTRCLAHQAWHYVKTNQLAHEIVSQVVVKGYHLQEIKLLEALRARRSLNLLRLHHDTAIVTDADRLQAQRNSQEAAQLKAMLCSSSQPEWLLRNAEVDTPAEFSDERPKVTGGTADLPQRNWR
eukprot:TRINITY_DN12517_c1_g1_i3.p1 TRINITY_DN12517_c1_g1~~TRINITY_DN12517_c1_g1_i3.p1  ORF type:complete len:435 (+),score=87.55 TRINITY_DN12517_c1_g1_i3:65-1369(+)